MAICGALHSPMEAQSLLRVHPQTSLKKRENKILLCNSPESSNELRKIFNPLSGISKIFDFVRCLPVRENCTYDERAKHALITVLMLYHTAESCYTSHHLKGNRRLITTHGIEDVLHDYKPLASNFSLKVKSARF